MPNSFRILTYRQNANAAGMQVHAAIIQDYSNSIAVMPFVRGPPAESTQEALRLLLEKVETMIGKRWPTPTLPHNAPWKGSLVWPYYLEN